jgi:hypothetical protein
MLQKLLAAILLLSHINFSMFIAQVDEVDTYDKKGKQQEDINSMVQYVAYLFNIKHKPLPDSDDDNARYSLIISMPLYDFQPVKIKSTREEFFAAGKKNEYSIYKEQNLLSPVIEISTPPPEEC